MSGSIPGWQYQNMNLSVIAVILALFRTPSWTVEVIATVLELVHMFWEDELVLRGEYVPTGNSMCSIL